jgi:hypothetical protein
MASYVPEVIVDQVISNFEGLYAAPEEMRNKQICVLDTTEFSIGK